MGRYFGPVRPIFNRFGTRLSCGRLFADWLGLRWATTAHSGGYAGSSAINRRWHCAKSAWIGQALAMRTYTRRTLTFT